MVPAPCEPGTPLSLYDARHLLSGCVAHYNNIRLNGATHCISPNHMLAGTTTGSAPLT